MTVTGAAAGRGTGLHAPLQPMPDSGPMFEWRRAVRTGDVDPRERLRLDGVARYLQDIASDHIAVMPAEPDGGDPVWVVRRSVIDVLRPVEWRERVHLQRWCSAMSTRWTTMRVRVEGSGGGLIETEGFWININRATGAPARISESLEADLMSRTTEHRLRWRPMLREPAPEPGGPGVAESAFPLRATDVDPLQHLNNAVYLQAVEEHLGQACGLGSRPHRAVVEYLRPIDPGADLRIRRRIEADAGYLWFLVDGAEHARAAVTALD